MRGKTISRSARRESPDFCPPPSRARQAPPRRRRRSGNSRRRRPPFYSAPFGGFPLSGGSSGVKFSASCLFSPSSLRRNVKVDVFHPFRFAASRFARANRRPPRPIVDAVVKLCLFPLFCDFLRRDSRSLAPLKEPTSETNDEKISEIFFSGRNAPPGVRGDSDKFH